MQHYHLSETVLPRIGWDPTGSRVQVRFNPRKDALLMDVTRAIMEAIDLNNPWLDSRLVCDVGEWVQGMALRAEEGLSGNYPGLKLNYYFVWDVVSWLGHFYGFPLYCDGNLQMEVEQTPYCPGCGRKLRLMWKLQYKASSSTSVYSPIWGCPSSNSTYKERCRPAINRVWPHRCPEFITKVGGRTIFFHDWEGDGNPIPPDYRIYPPTEWSKGLEEDEIEEVTEDTDGIYLPTKPPALMGRKSLTPREIETIVDTYPTKGWRGFFEAYPGRRGLSKKDIQDEARKQGVTKKRVFRGRGEENG